MESQTILRANLHRSDHWQHLLGEIVEVWRDGKLYRRAVVDAIMPDASGLWISLEGVFERKYIDAAAGFEVWTTLYPCSGEGGASTCAEA
ncbi:hypothetical protein [Paenarthrobacter nitroguajacolicus]|uniref:hypothetical protein n=1 Tax=Paenarthrobacter nitroguajacolicus TaxID=211146 RepID=UPI00248B197F|nr:hypothetical protein [Paenarthrobacter nitroguajacolicus]MDI2037208.1 hypothetical protein [Paenarthrobacter nitroguajacolicus]